MPLEPGCEVSISPLYFGSIRSAQHFGGGRFFFLQHVLVPAEADRAGVEAADQVAAHGVLAHRPAVQVVQVGSAGRRRAGRLRPPAGTGSPVPPHQRSVFGLAASARICASASPVALRTCCTLTPVCAWYSLAASSHQLWSVEQIAVSCWPALRRRRPGRCKARGQRAVARGMAGSCRLPADCDASDYRQGSDPAERADDRAQAHQPHRAEPRADHDEHADRHQRDRARSRARRSVA